MMKRCRHDLKHRMPSGKCRICQRRSARKARAHYYVGPIHTAEPKRRKKHLNLTAKEIAFLTAKNVDDSLNEKFNTISPDVPYKEYQNRKIGAEINERNRNTGSPEKRS